MNLAAGMDQLLAGARAHKQATLRDRCEITRPGVGERRFDSATNTYTDPPPTPVYAGPCRVKATTTSPREVQAAEQEIALRQYTVELPFGAPTPVRPGDRVAVTVAADAWVLGRPLVAVAVGYSSTTTARRIVVEEAA